MTGLKNTEAHYEGFEPCFQMDRFFAHIKQNLDIINNLIMGNIKKGITNHSVTSMVQTGKIKENQEHQS